MLEEEDEGLKEDNFVRLGKDKKCFLKSALEGTNRTNIEGWVSGPKKCRTLG